MKLNQYWQAVKNAFYKELSSTVLIWSCVWGVWIAFCPFLGFHTALVFVCSWVFALNFSIVLGLSMLINNPWTMLPVYYFDYKVGVYGYLMLWGAVPENPFWLQPVLAYMQKQIQIPHFSLWAFIVGGVCTATVAAMITYLVAVGYVFFKSSVEPKDQL